MKSEDHYRALERMYLAAPINAIYSPTVVVSREKAEIEIAVSRRLFHAGGAAHGSVYFKMLDDAAYFAANSIVTDCFLLTASFTTYLIRPISSGRMKSTGTVVSKSKTQIIAEAVAFNSKGKEIGRGNGIFVRSKLSLAEAMGYGDRPPGSAPISA